MSFFFFCLTENEDVSAAREYYQSSGRDASGTLTRMPRKRHVERQLLLGLQKHASSNNYYGAFSFVSGMENGRGWGGMGMSKFVLIGITSFVLC